MERIQVNVTTGEQKIIKLTPAEVNQVQAQAEQAAQEQTQWKIANAVMLRQQAYVSEADPLFFKAQRGEATMADWKAKVAEIKARYPKEQS